MTAEAPPTLLSRVLAATGATGADREIDWKLADRFGWFMPHLWAGNRADPYGVSRDPDGVIIHTGWGNSTTRHLQPYTSSIDAAVALVEKVRPEGRWSVYQLAGNYEGVIARNFQGRTDKGPHEVCAESAATPALALLAALLRSLDQ